MRESGSHPFRRWAVLSVVAWLTVGGSASLSMAKPAKPIKGDAAIELLFDGVQPAIRECALSHAIYKGVTVVELEATLMVARDGSVFGAQVTAQLTPKERVPSPTALQTCVTDALRKMKFAAASDTFRKLLRKWKFATA